MKQIYLFCFLLLNVFIGFSGEVKAEKLKLHSENASPMILIEHAYIRATIPGTTHSSSYMEIENTGENAVTLLSAKSDISDRIEIHQHLMNDGMMRMRKLEALVIESKTRVKLQPSGLHLMLFDVKKPLKPKQTIEVTLNFSNNVSVIMPIPVYGPTQEKSAQKTVTAHEHHH